MSASSGVVLGCGVLFILASFLALSEDKSSALVWAYLSLGIANISFGLL